MFGNLIESNSHREAFARRGSFFLGTLVVYAGLFLVLAVGSIYAYNIQFEDQNLELVALVAPVEPVREQTPRAATSPRSQPGSGGGNSKPIVVSRTPIIAEMDSTRVPKGVSVAPPVPELPPGMRHTIGNPKVGENIFGGGNGKNSAGGSGGGNNSGGDNGSGFDELARHAPPPPVIKKEIAKPPAKKVVVSGGVVNGRASTLPRPVYTSIAKAARASGVVTVQVLIDETGKVVSASAVSGHPLLQRESVLAAYQARFTPTLLGGQPVRVSGVITYNFMLQ